MSGRFPRDDLRRFIGLLALAVLLSPALAEAAPPHAYLAAQIWPGDGPPITNGVLLIQDGKVLAVGPRGQVKVPDNAEVHDLAGLVIIPGLVVAETTLGERGRDDERALTPEFRAIDGFDFYANYRNAVSGGVTTVQISPGSRRLMPGQGAVVKLAGGEPSARVLRERESLRVLLGDAYKNAPRIYEPPIGAVSVDKPLEPTRPQLSESLAGAIAGLRATLRAAREESPSSAGRGDRDPMLAAVNHYLTGGGLVRVSAPAAADLRGALALAGEFQLKLLLVDPPDLSSFRGQLPEWRDRVAGVVVNAEVRPGAVTDKRPLPWKNARELLAAGYKVAIRPAADSDLDDMLFVAGLFTAGLSGEEVLKMVTLNAADLLGVADRVGSLARGKDADFVVLDGAPFGTHTRVRSVFVNGQSAFAAKSAAKATVIQAGQVYTGTGERIQGGAVLVEGATVRGLGRDVSLPPEAAIRRYENGVVVPGWIDLGAGLGLGGPLQSQVPLQTRLGERLVSGDPDIAGARQGGVTTVLLSSASGTTSPVVAFKLGDRPRVVRDPVAIRFAVTGNLTSQGAALRSALQAGRAYAQSWTSYEAAQGEYEKKKKAFDEAKAQAEASAKAAEAAAKSEGKTDAKEAKKEPAKKEEPKAPEPPEKPRVQEGMEPYRLLFANQIPALVEASRADAIKLALAIFRDEFKVRVILLGGEDAFRMADVLAEKQVAVAVGPELVRTVEREPVNLAQVLAVRGVPFGFQSRASAGVKTLPLAVQYAVRRGLGVDDALAGFTAAPARFLSIERQLGSLAVGKDADLVVLSGPPFELSTRVLAVMIDGEWVYEEKEER